jgi:hypothetical protein
MVQGKKTKNKSKHKNQNKNKTTEIIDNLIKHDCFSVHSLRKHLSILPEGKIATPYERETKLAKKSLKIPNG